jgi:long-subunit fatty acid transport protein
MLGGENISTFSFKTDLSDRLVAAVVIDQRVWAAVNYGGDPGNVFSPTNPTGDHPFAGSTATLDSRALTFMLRYKFDGGMSVYGGLRAQQVEGTVDLPSAGGYKLQTNNDSALGYMLGDAYERPDIALRVALTYNSAIDHSFAGKETSSVPFPGFDMRDSDFDTTIPQSVNLEFQTGIAADTLLFGSIRWVDWSSFEINPSLYSDIILAGNPFGITYPLAGYESDTITYRLGVGRRFTENWAGAITLIHEPKVNDIFGNLGPIDGRDAIALGVTYTQDRFKISGGVEYSWLGDALSQSPRGRPGDPVSDFQDNTSISYGIRIGYYF